MLKKSFLVVSDKDGTGIMNDLFHQLNQDSKNIVRICSVQELKPSLSQLVQLDPPQLPLVILPSDSLIEAFDVLGEFSVKFILMNTTEKAGVCLGTIALSPDHRDSKSIERNILFITTIISLFDAQQFMDRI